MVVLAARRSPTSSSTAVGPIVAGEFIAARWNARGTYAGDIPGATATAGTTIEFSGNDIMRIANGMITEYWTSSDGLHLMAQLGVGQE